ncbi:MULTISPECIES: ABC transporter permease [Modicisalibacter]|uniref:ABC transporter permease n=1 Tax=Modicisalibacter TaxID=574347 RepID=UPI001CCEB672|nr:MULTISPECIES: ABC transporter permease [Modicisalibacter]MBZ9538894.1 ABC transporter permease [Modicisalibacter tunisiensis]MBZ9559603.1 ABC transporter permease [Modicisalibacter sp. R2A 31.J]MBZ9577055.1 ABC transporter permease [Modicisalibacter sp. MOD 31.J]
MTSTTTAPFMPPPSWLSRFLRGLRGERTGMLGFVLVTLIVLAAIFAPWLSPYDPTAIMTGPPLAPPSSAHWLGTDNLGRDLFSRVLAGGRVAMLVAAAALSAALTLGVALGLLAGLGPRWLDNLLLLIFDAIRSFPVIVFGLAVVTLVGPSLFTVVLVVAITSVPIYARIIRTQAQSLRSAEFVLAERAMGASLPRLLGIHVLPNVLGPLLILASMDVPLVIATEAGLSFLGMGVRPPTPSWGVILNDGYNFIRNSPWPVVAGSVPIVLVTLGFTFLGEALRDIFDPRLQKAN